MLQQHYNNTAARLHQGVSKALSEQCVAVCCSVLQCVAVCCASIQVEAGGDVLFQRSFMGSVAVRCSVL